jgi:hypothetical protein
MCGRGSFGRFVEPSKVVVEETWSTRTALYHIVYGIIRGDPCCARGLSMSKRRSPEAFTHLCGWAQSSKAF